MGNAVSTHSQVVHHRHTATLRVIASMAVLGLSGTVAIVAASGDSDVASGTTWPPAAVAPIGDVRYDGGPEEGSRGPLSSGTAAGAPAAVRYDGGPEEGTRGIARGR